MATAFLLWSSSKEKKLQESENPQSETQDLKHENSKHRPKRASKSQSTAPKRPPQRGLGVAQLERLRLEERRNKLAESDPSQAQNLNFQFPFSVADPSAFARFAPTNYTAVAAVAEAQMLCRMANGGFPVAGPDFSGVSGVFHGQAGVDRMRIAAAAAHGTRLQMARELSSSQRLQCLSDQCEVCFKKKRLHGENSGFNGWSSSNTRFAEVEAKGCDFLGLNLGGGRAVHGEGSKCFGERGEKCGGFSGMHVHEGVEVIAAAAAAQSKGKSVGECNLREYEFFPRKGSSSSSRGGGGGSAPFSAPDPTAGEASPSTTTAYCSNFLDLSLKLSF